MVITPLTTSISPVITGIVPNQTVSEGGTIKPFSTVSVSDANFNATDMATINMVNNTGDTSANGTLSGVNDLTTFGGGIYTLPASDPATIGSEIDSIVFTPNPIPNGQTSVATFINLGITDQTPAGTITNATTTVLEDESGPTGQIPGAPQGVTYAPPNNFMISDQTTGEAWQSAGDSYTGPVTGLTSDIIITTSDNINVTAEKPTVFIHTGSGEDAIDVSRVNGNNIMDGSTGSNFLTGGTGNDTFYLDDRSPTATIWSTMVNFHSGDNATIWGITQAGFGLSWADGMGATGATGLTGTLTAPGQPNAMITLAGLTTADLTNGVLSIAYGTSPNTPGLPGSNYMQIHNNG
jgi:hypothetical protein